METNLNDGSWHHIALVCDRPAGRFSLYVDGQFTATTPLGSLGGLSTTTPLAIGQDGSLNFEWCAVLLGRCVSMGLLGSICIAPWQGLAYYFLSLSLTPFPCRPFAAPDYSVAGFRLWRAALSHSDIAAEAAPRCAASFSAGAALSFRPPVQPSDVTVSLPMTDTLLWTTSVVEVVNAGAAGGFASCHGGPSAVDTDTVPVCAPSPPVPSALPSALRSLSPSVSASTVTLLEPGGGLHCLGSVYGYSFTVALQ